MARSVIIAVLALALAPAGVAHAQSSPPPAAKSANVTPIRTLPEPQAISANFRGNIMYLSHLRGLSIYDISNPEAPQRLSTMPLPHFQNEDVDTNGEILLISNDPSEGVGMLYVIDVRDPRNPRRIGQLQTGTIAPLGPLYGTGHTASCINNCQWAYLAGNDNGIHIVDLRNPAAPVMAGEFAAPEATGAASHDVQVDSQGLAWLAGHNGTAAYDTTDPLRPRAVYRTDESAVSKYTATEENPTQFATTDGSSLNDYVMHNSLRLDNASLASPPAGASPTAESDVVLITEEDLNRPTCKGAGQFETWRIGGDGVLRNLDSFVVEVDPSRATLCSAHYFDERGGLVAQGWYEGGTRFLDVTNPADIRQVGYWIPQKNQTWGAYYAPTDPTGSIVYSLDNARGVDVIKIDRGRPDTSTPPLGGGTAGSGEGAGASPNIRLKIGDRRRTVRAGKRTKYTINVRNGGRGQANGIAVTVNLPRGVARVRGGRKAGRTVRFRIAQLAPKQTKRVKLLVKVGRGFRGRRLEIAAAATANGDAEPHNNYWVDRNRVRGARKARASRNARGNALARQTARMPDAIAPKLGAAEAKATGYKFGQLCRIAVD